MAKTTMCQMLKAAGLDMDQVLHLQVSRRETDSEAEERMDRWVESGDDEGYGERMVLLTSKSQIKAALNREFDDSFGGVEGPAVTAYTAERIYFSCCYDGAEWVESIPRNPDQNHTPCHYGGG